MGLRGGGGRRAGNVSKGGLPALQWDWDSKRDGKGRQGIERTGQSLNQLHGSRKQDIVRWFKWDFRDTPALLQRRGSPMVS